MAPDARYPSGWAWPRRGDDPGRRAARWLAAGAMTFGCSGPPGAGRALGTDLGTFGVEAAIGTNECGPGTLGSTAEFAFDVDLARGDGELFWDGVGGRIGPELDFEVSAS